MAPSAGRQSGRQAVKQAGSQAGRQSGRQAGSQAGRQAGRLEGVEGLDREDGTAVSFRPSLHRRHAGPQGT